MRFDPIRDRFQGRLFIFLFIMLFVACAEQASRADREAPLWVAGYPRLEAVTQTNGQVLVAIQEQGHVYWALVPEGAIQPSSGDLRSGTVSAALSNGSLGLARAQQGTILLHGLSPASNYSIYLVSEDQQPQPNLLDNPALLALRRDGPATNLTVTYHPNGADGGSVPVDSACYDAGQAVTVPGNTGGLTRTHYVFRGWRTAAWKQRTPGDDFNMPGEHVVLYAEWGLGQISTCSLDGVLFDLVWIPGGLTFYTRTDNSETAAVSTAFWLGKTEVTYQLWDTVYTWAATNGYGFANAGRQGGDSGSGPVGTSQHPVTTINWRDALVWCNALTGYYNRHQGTSYAYVYCTDPEYTTPVKTANSDTSWDSTPGSVDTPYIRASFNGNTNMANCNADGFRLPTHHEWQLAARFISDNGDNVLSIDGESYPGTHASGADAAHDAISGGSDLDADGDVDYTTAVSVYSNNSGGSTAAVASKQPNVSGLYDMCGNVEEWSFDIQGSGYVYLRTGGGSFASGGTSLGELQIGYLRDRSPWQNRAQIGFRIARSVE